MRKQLLYLFRLYFKYFPIRKGKIPIMKLIDKIGFTRNIQLKTKFDKNISINLNLDDWIQKQIFYFGRYEIEKKETLIWGNIISRNQVIVDIGANIGYYTMQAAARVGTNGTIYAFEPVTATYNKLIANIKLNSFNNIITEKLAISDAEGKLELFVADEKSTGSSSISMHVNFSGLIEEVKTIPLDNYVDLKNINSIDIIKIDVEGCEPMVIKGMINIMNKMKPLILIEILDERLNTVNSSKEKLYDLLASNNYFPFKIINESEVTPINAPEEGPLIIFKHTERNLPSHITII